MSERSKMLQVTTMASVVAGALALMTSARAQDPAPAAKAAAPETGRIIEIPWADPCIMVESSADGRRTEFAPIPADTAFEVWLDGLPPKVELVPPTDPANPDAKPLERTRIPILRLSLLEWDDYTKYIRSLAPIGDEGMFVTVTLHEMLEQKSALLYNHDQLTEVKKRTDTVLKRLKSGLPFKEAVKLLTEDETQRQAGGLFGNERHGGYLNRYPLEKVLFGLKQGDTIGPIFDKYASYFFYCDGTFTHENDRKRDRVSTSAITVRYTTGAQPSGIERGRITHGLRTRTDVERFRRILPPGIQVPPVTKFGPDDVAPLGEPDRPLKQRSPDDARDDKPIPPVKPEAPAKPDDGN